MKAKNLLMSLLVGLMIPVTLLLSACGSLGNVEGKNMVLYKVELTWGATADEDYRDEMYSSSGVENDAGLKARALEEGFMKIVGLNFKADGVVELIYANEDTEESEYTQEGNIVSMPGEGASIITFEIKGKYLTCTWEEIDEDTEAIMATFVYYFKVA